MPTSLGNVGAPAGRRSVCLSPTFNHTRAGDGKSCEISGVPAPSDLPMRLPLHLILVAALPLAGAARAAESSLSYNRDVRPILSDKCFYCHGPDKNHRKGKMRLDVREDALAKEAFVPGQPDESELIKRIFTTNEEDMMPPPDAHKTLTAAQKELFKRWIAEGAKYEPHWAYIPPVRAAVPKVGQSVSSKTVSSEQSRAPKGSSVRTDSLITDSLITPPNPIDGFILAELARRNLQPSPEADRRTLLRRLSLDLTGLPPTPEEMAAFLKDQSAQAYEKQVKRLLASPHYGERMAVPWLDVVRFTDTVGYHGDQNANVFPYRDYVINSFNQNKPFSQFTLEQLAGDLLPNNTVEQRIATGFNRLNMMTREGGAQPGEYLAKYGADRARTVGMAWLGLTVGCAECHDHKFDPIATKDFYSLKAFFADVKQWGVYNDYKYTPNPDLKNWSNEHPFPPEEVVDSPYLQRRLEKLRGQIAALADATAEKADAKQKMARADWKKTSEAVLRKSPDGWLVPRALVVVSTNTVVSTNKVAVKNVATVATNQTSPATLKTNVTVVTNFVVQAEGALLFGMKANDNSPIALTLSKGWVAALRLELLPHAQHSNTIFRGNNKSGSLQLSATLQRAGTTNVTKLAFYHADADRKEPRYANGFEIIGIKDTWKVARDHAQEKQTGVWLLDPPLQVADGDTLAVTLKTNLLGCLRFSVSPLVPGSSRGHETPIGNIDQSLLTSAATKDLAWLTSTAPETNAFAEYKKLHREILECRDGKSPTLVTISRKPDITRVLPRGNWQAENGEVVEPQPPHFLPQPKPAGTNRLTRLDLAQWIVSSDNPLTARVTVNRLWKQFFGNALANPVDDFGSQGEPPSHPELLDWLAMEFMQPTVNVPPASRRVVGRSNTGTRPEAGGTLGWDIKHLVELIVTSSTYKQSANLRPELRDLDPNNRLLASQNPRRLEAEFVRDNALAIASLLNRDLGGPSAHPYQPAGYYENIQFPDRDYHADKDDRQYRRGLYSHWQRTFLQPMLANFDAPAREECIAARNVSNTPQQALTLLNDPTFVEAARVWAAKLLQSKAKSDESRLELAYQQALGRPVKAGELASLKQFLAAQRQHLAEDKDEAVKLQKVGLAQTAKDLDAHELGAWISVCRVILNLQETITRY